MLKIVAVAVAMLATPTLDHKNPSDVGMDDTRLTRIEYVVNQGMKYGAYPGAAVVVGKDGVIVWEKGYGHKAYGDNSNVIPVSTIYDLASLTKVVAATTAIMLLYDRGLIKLDDKVQTYLPGFTGNWKDQVTIKHLLTHTSGLPAGRNLPKNLVFIARNLVLETSLRHTPGSVVIYSDLGMVVLGMIVEKISNMPLDQFTRDSIFIPMQMTNTMYLPASNLNDRIAPTLSITGKVNDPIAQALNGVAGNAGLFSTATDLAIFSQMMLNNGRLDSTQFFKPETIKLFTSTVKGNRALGWQTCSKSEYGCGALSKSSFGHTGYTGTSMWIDPETNTFVIVLTNRVYSPKTRRSQRAIVATRTDIANIVQSSVDESANVVGKLKIDVANTVQKIKKKFRKSKVTKKKRRR